jgi:hypothetical protein
MRLLWAALALLCAACSSNGATCDTKTDDLGEICLPAQIAPGIPAQFDVRELCSPGCSSNPSCSALFINGAVVLDVENDVCSDQLTSATCVAMGCLQRTVRCDLPALGAGDYPLIVPGGPPRLLRVRPGGSSSCRFFDADGGVP